MIEKVTPAFVLAKAPVVKFIVLKDNEISCKYYEEARPTWQKYAPDLQLSSVQGARVEDLSDWHKRYNLPFGSKAPVFRYTKWREFTPSEIACWYAHYHQWVGIYNRGEAAVICEHDCMAVRPINWRVHFRPWDIVCFTQQKKVRLDGTSYWRKVPCGGYYMSPHAAQRALEIIPDYIILNVDDIIHRICTNVGEYSFLAQHPTDCIHGTTVDHGTDDDSRYDL